MSFVGYDYIRQPGMRPEEADGAVLNEIFDSQ